MRNRALWVVFLSIPLFLGQRSLAQSQTGTLEVAARISPTGGHPEPIRQFTLYVLTRSYADIQQDVASQFPLADRDTFLSELKISPELKAWMKEHEIMDLTAPETDKLISPDDVMNIPEFFAAYLRSNSGGVTKGLPIPKYRDSDQQANPARHEKQKQEYLATLKKFIERNPSTIVGMETEMGGVNPKFKWDTALQEHNQKIAQLAPELAQTKYLAAKGDTDLDGRLVIQGLPAGNYWVTSLGMDAVSGDRHLLWDVAVKLQAGQAVHVELNNINGRDLKSELR